MREALVVVAGLSACAGEVWCSAPESNDADAVRTLGIRAVVRSSLIDDLDQDLRVLHDYGPSVLVALGRVPSPPVATGIHVLESGRTVGFRGWRGIVDLPDEPRIFADGVFVLRLIGPLDQLWRSAMDALDVDVLSPAHPHALIVRADGARLALASEMTTSEGVPVIQGIRPLPDEARVHRSLVPVLDKPVGRGGLELFGYHGRPVEIDSKTRSAAGGIVLRDELARRPEIGYAEPVFGVQAHNNLAVRSGLVGVEAAWDLGYTGDGVVISHNDSGVDLGQPELAAAVIVSEGRMTYTDSAHGTHTAGSIVGLGTVPAPVNLSGCGDLVEGLDHVSGMAPAAKIATNNIFVDGHGEVSGMMAWGVEHGAHLSSNSWGQVGPTGPVTGYTVAAVQADAAVRDADPGRPGPQPLSIFFSAGNTGPDGATVTSPGTAKNVITVGAVQNARCGAWVPSQQEGPDLEAVLDSSGRGPSQGRIKPDVVAPGSDVLSLESQDDYAVQVWDEAWTGPDLALNTGTSQACALAAGAGAVLHEALWRSRGRRPSPALLKAALTVTAVAGPNGFDDDRGWGRIDLRHAVLGLTGGSATFVDQDETAVLASGQRWSDEIVVRSSSQPLLLAVVWTDVPGEEDAEHPLVNDLDVVMTAPGGAVYRGNALATAWSTANPGAARDADNNIEVVRIQTPEVGTWTLEVTGVDVAVAPPGLDGQDFVVAYSGDAGPCEAAPPAPSDVMATDDGPNRIRVEWAPVVGATRYEVSRAVDAGGRPYEPIGMVGAGVLTFVDANVSGDVDYFYVVRAERSCWSAYSSEVRAMGNGPCLEPPLFAGLAAVEPQGRSGCDLRLSWTPASGRCPEPVVFDIYRDTEDFFEPGLLNLVREGVAGSSWMDRGLAAGIDHHYLVRARHSGAETDDGNLVFRGARPTGPDDVYLESGAEQGLDDWIRGPAGSADSGTEPWHTTDDDASSGRHSWFVADEDRIKDQVLLTAEPVDLPTGVAPILSFTHRFRLHQGGDGGRLEYSTNGGLDWYDILEGDGQTVPDDAGRWRSGGYTATIGGLENPLYGEQGWTGDSRGWFESVADLEAMAGRRILLRWRFACDADIGLGWGWWLDEIRLVVEKACRSCVTSEPPSGLQAVANSGGVSLSWFPATGAAAYQISRSTIAGGPYVEVATVEAPMTEYRDSSVSGGSTYSYVVAVDDGCLSGPSAGVTVTAEGPCTLAPLFWGLDAVVDRREPGCALDLSWRRATAGCSGAAVDHRIYRSSSPVFLPGPDTLIADRVAGPRFRDTTVIDGELYFYLVRAVDRVSGLEDANPVQHSGWTTGPEEVHLSDSVEGDLGRWWIATGSSLDSGTEPWRVDENAFDGQRSWFCADEPVIKDQVVGLAEAFEVVDPSTVLVFDQLFDLEPFWDGGRLEYSTDGGSEWHDMLSGDGAGVTANPDRFLRGGYNGIASPGTGHPFGGQRVWTGFNGVWTETTVDLADFVGASLLFRWRLGCDRSDARVGWWIDHVEIRTTTVCETLTLAPPRAGGGRHP